MVKRQSHSYTHSTSIHKEYNRNWKGKKKTRRESTHWKTPGAPMNDCGYTWTPIKGQRTALVWVPTLHLALDRVFVPQPCWGWPSFCGFSCLRLCHSRTTLPYHLALLHGILGSMLAHHVLHPLFHLPRISPGTFSCRTFLHSVESLESLGRGWECISVVEHLLACIRPAG